MHKRGILSIKSNIPKNNKVLQCKILEKHITTNINIVYQPLYLYSIYKCDMIKELNIFNNSLNTKIKSYNRKLLFISIITFVCIISFHVYFYLMINLMIAINMLLYNICDHLL